jgi:hypothetical protein
MFLLFEKNLQAAGKLLPVFNMQGVAAIGKDLQI